MTTDAPPDQPGSYEPFFGLNESPFSLAPDPRFLFASASHSAALAQVAHALERREPLVVITGEIGTGKTLLCRTVLQRLPFKTFLSVIHDPLLDSDDLVKELLKDFGVISKDPARFKGASRHQLVQTLHAFLFSLAPIQAHAVVMIDEAQHLRPEVLEQIRLLSNIDDTHGTALQIILVGQMDLERLLSRPELRQLQQRVSRRFALEPLNKDEVQQYIEHRLALARQGQEPSPQAGPGVEFTPDAIQTVAQISAGVPRVINLLCDRSLELAFAARVHTIDGPLIAAAARALGIEVPAEAPAASSAVAGSVRPASEAATETVRPADEPLIDIAPPAEEAVARAFGAEAHPAPGPSFAKYVVLMALVAVLGIAVLFGLRRAQAPPADAPPPAAAAPRDAVAQPERAPARSDATVPQKSAVAGETPSPQPGAAAAAASDTRFEIVVASFKTEARATSVAEEVTALGIPVRHRAADSWQQVIAGPFASRTEAEQAQQRIHGAGLTGTQIVPAAR